ncbi:acyltransferase ChoActase/COT/CPT [Kockovaella imperatae]|uniref:Acyltransferase ChoActase/COT/CPT n=1 Tax=Kockovaella imperatae TaxID=4999 RepID=A0A1Y1UHQ9_9TREE|nr:acyltransferase ChoActase/COT/CPT [Kockovaella imperatae]ORX37603.1 acyltransferase ChoActase/COT/CPT [Kockovaella imperatae]
MAHRTGLTGSLRALHATSGHHIRRVYPVSNASRGCASQVLDNWRRPYASSASEGAGPSSTFSNQDKLPRLPIPDLDKTLQAYIKSLQPIMADKFSKSDLPHEVEKRRLFARDFAAPGGLGRQLQERLTDLDLVSPNSWLTDALWLSLAYHSWRAPLIVNSNWAMLFGPDAADSDHPNPNPQMEAASGSQGGGEEYLSGNPSFKKGQRWDELVQREEVTSWQIRRASWLVRKYAELREKVAREELPPDVSRSGKPLCMHQFTRLFNFVRIPLPGSDAFTNPAPKATHISVMIDDFVYSVEVFSPAGSDGIPTPLPVGQIEKSLQAVVADAKARRNHGEQAVKVGVLTADDRDAWCANRERLISLSPNNRHSLDSISKSLLCLSLDTYTLPSLPTEDPLAQSFVDAQLHNAFVGINGGTNRWYDKPTDLVVETNGRAGICGEHSATDAIYHAAAIDYIMQESVDDKAFSSSSHGSTSKGWERIDWVIDAGLKKEISACQERNRKLMADTDASQLWWNEYGVEWIKKHAKISPDAYIQQALQLAYFKDQGSATATYESASTRSTLHGRTETIRSLTTESRAFVKSMMDASQSSEKRYKLLSEACTAHTALSKLSNQGLGIDRHLMGLKVLLRPGETHQLFEDEMFGKSQEWKMCSSGLTAGGTMMGGQFGSAWPDGYSISYFAGPYLLKFGVEGKWSAQTTSSARFKHHLVQSLRDMRKVVEEAAK